MKVYVVQLEDEIKGVYTECNLAMSFVDKREGQLSWKEHNSHGICWVAEHSFRINNGPLIKNIWCISEHELAVVETAMRALHELDQTCVVCSATLFPSDAPPHCMDCLPNEEQKEAWAEARRVLLKASKG